MENKNKQILKGISLTIISAIFAVFGIAIASTQNLIIGILIVVASSLFWGYACLLSRIVELRSKRTTF
jgi:drug/metabolite transporter (DMT)-like permease